MLRTGIIRLVVFLAALAALTAAYTMDRSHTRSQPAATSRG
jgi:hypothetical protein